MHNTAEHTLIRAARYVRMSTEHQQYSTENQADTIDEYAARHHIEIVRTYADEGNANPSQAGQSGFCVQADARAQLPGLQFCLYYLPGVDRA